MEFPSFEEALYICLTAEPGSPEQDAAMIYCLENAPDDLKAMLMDRLGGGCDCGEDHDHDACGHHHGDCGCGCSHD